MNICLTSFKKGIGAGLPAGMISFGVVAILLNMLTNAFQFEESLLYNLVIFTAGGALFGVLAGGVMGLTYDRLPSGTPLLKGVMVCVALWLILRFGGFLLSVTSPVRFHPNTAQTIQGFALSILLGIVTGIFWKASCTEHKC